MSRPPIRTTTGKQVIEALDEQLARARDNSDGPMDTYSRRYWTGQVDALKLARGVVESLIGYIESDAVQRAMPGIGLTEAEFLLGDPAEPAFTDDPADPTLPFVRESVAA